MCVHVFLPVCMFFPLHVCCCVCEFHEEGFVWSVLFPKPFPAPRMVPNTEKMLHKYLMDIWFQNPALIFSKEIIAIINQHLLRAGHRLLLYLLYTKSSQRDNGSIPILQMRKQTCKKWSKLFKIICLASKL